MFLCVKLLISYFCYCYVYGYICDMEYKSVSDRVKEMFRGVRYKEDALCEDRELMEFYEMVIYDMMVRGVYIEFGDFLLTTSLVSRVLHCGRWGVRLRGKYICLDRHSDLGCKEYLFYPVVRYFQDRGFGGEERGLLSTLSKSFHFKNIVNKIQL